MIRAVAEYVRNLQDVNDLEAIAKDIFKLSQVSLPVCLVSSFRDYILYVLSQPFFFSPCCFQSRTDDKLVRFKKAVEYYSAASKPPQSSSYIGKFMFAVISQPFLSAQCLPKSFFLWLARVQVRQTGSVFLSSLPASDLSVMLEIFPLAPRPCVHFGMAAMPHAYK